MKVVKSVELESLSSLEERLVRVPIQKVRLRTADDSTDKAQAMQLIILKGSDLEFEDCLLV